MIDLSLEEAQLFRMLAGFFGGDRVVVRVSVLCLCGGTLPAAVCDRQFDLKEGGLQAWARANSCLFTIVDEEGEPRLVVEFACDFEQTVDLAELERCRYLTPILAARHIPYVAISPGEFADLVSPGAKLDIVAFLSDKIEEIVGRPPE